MAKSDLEEISIKNKKDEILAAYHKALEKSEELNKKSRQQEQTLEKQRKLTESAAQQSPQKIEESLTELRQRINDKLREVGESVTHEMQRLKDIREAISLEESNLKNLYEINKAAHTLDILLLAHKQEQAKFDEIMAEKRKAWEKEQAEFTEKLKEEQTDKKKAWAREQEEYNYKIKVEREKEAHTHAKKQAEQNEALKQKQHTLESAFAEREALLKASETELTDLREQVTTFPTQLETAIKQAENSMAQNLEREHKFKFDLLAKERESEKQLSQQKIESLAQKLASQEKLIQELSNKVNRSVNQVQDIAFKAIEGASRQPYFREPSTNKTPVTEET